MLPERLREANEIRHCALSLVGEPIMYPEINAFLDYLHQRNISSFLVRERRPAKGCPVGHASSEI